MSNKHHNTPGNPGNANKPRAPEVQLVAPTHVTVEHGATVIHDPPLVDPLAEPTPGERVDRVAQPVAPAEQAPAMTGGYPTADLQAEHAPADRLNAIRAYDALDAAPATAPERIWCHVTARVSAAGATRGGHPREHWEPGEEGLFPRSVVESAPDCFRPLPAS